MRKLLAAIAALIIGGAAAPAFAAGPTSYETPWSNAMNQESYWETALATPGRTVDCTKYSNHNGYIPAEYDAAILKDGSSVVKVYPDLTSTGAFTATGAINPANGKPYGAPHSWVMKCKFRTVTTTTTTVPPTTTTAPPTTTIPPTTLPPTTLPPETTQPPTTTTPETVPPTTTPETTAPPVTTAPTTTAPPATVPPTTAAPTTTVDVTTPPTVGSTVVITTPHPTTTTVPPTLPKTGSADTFAIGLVAGFLIVAGAALLGVRRSTR